MMRARANWPERSRPAPLSMRALVRIICVAGSARGDTKVTWQGARAFPASSMISTGVPTASVAARSIGTLT